LLLTTLLLFSTFCIAPYLPALLLEQGYLPLLPRHKLRQIRPRLTKRHNRTYYRPCPGLGLFSPFCFRMFSTPFWHRTFDLRNAHIGRNKVVIDGDVHRNPGPTSTHMPSLTLAQNLQAPKTNRTPGTFSSQPWHDIHTLIDDVFHKRDLSRYNDLKTTPPASTGITFASFNIQGAGGMTTSRWTKTLMALQPLQVDILALQEYQPLFPLPEATTTGLMPSYTLLAHQVSGPGIAFLVKNTVLPQVVSTEKDSQGHAFTLVLNSAGASLRVTNVYSKFSHQDKQHLDCFLQANPPDVLLGDFNAPIWSTKPDRPWQLWLQEGKLSDPLILLTPDTPLRDMATRFGHSGNPKRIDAILIRPNLPTLNISSYDTFDLPLSDHRLVLMGSSWTAEMPAHRMLPRPSVTWWGPKQFLAYNARMLSFCQNIHTSGTPQQKATTLLHEIKRYAECMHNIRYRKRSPPQQCIGPKDDISPLRKLIKQMRVSAVVGSKFFYKLTKQWKEGLLQKTRPQPLLDNVQETLSNFAGNPEWNSEASQTMIDRHFHSLTWDASFPTFDTFDKCLTTPKCKASGPDGIPPYLLYILPPQGKQILYLALQEIWEGRPIPRSWNKSRVTLIYKNKDSRQITNYRPITVTTAMYRILTKMMLTTLQPQAETLLSPEQFGGKKGKTTTAQTCNLLQNLKSNQSFITLLDVAKAFPSVPRPLMTNLLSKLDIPSTTLQLWEQIYTQTGCTIQLQGQTLSYSTRRGLKEGCPLSPLMFLLYYELLLKELKLTYPSLKFFAYMDDLAFIANSPQEVQMVLSTLTELSHALGFRFNKGKTEIIFWGKHTGPKHIPWDGVDIPVHSGGFTYLGHPLTHTKFLTNTLHFLNQTFLQDISLYDRLPLNVFERIKLVNTVLIPRWSYRALFLLDISSCSKWDKSLLTFVTNCPGIEPTMSTSRIITDLRLGGLGMRTLWWSHAFRWISLVQPLLSQSALLPYSPPHRSYLQLLASLGLKPGYQRPQTRKTGSALTLLDSDSSDQEDTILHLPQRCQQLSTDWFTPAPEASDEDSRRALQHLPNKMSLLGIDLHYRGTPTESIWYTDGSKQLGRSGGGIINGHFAGSFRIPGTQDVYRAEVVACTIAATLAKPQDIIKLDNKACANSIAVKRARVVPDQDFRDLAYQEISAKNLLVQWTPGHVNLHETPTYASFRDARGNHAADEMAKIGTLLQYPAHPTTHPWDILLNGSKLPLPPKTWIMKLRRQKVVEAAHWTTWLPLKSLRRSSWVRWLWGQVRWPDCGAPWERHPSFCPHCPKLHGTSVQMRLAHCDLWKPTFFGAWVTWWGGLSQLASQWLSTATDMQLWTAVCLHIPLSLINSLPFQERPLLRRHVALFQFQAIQGVKHLMEKFLGPPIPDTSHISPIWLTPYIPPKPGPTPLPTAKLLREYVHAPWGIRPRRKISLPPSTPLNVDEWLAHARRHQDTEAVQHILSRPVTIMLQKQQLQLRFIAILETFQVLLHAHAESVLYTWTTMLQYQQLRQLHVTLHSQTEQLYGAHKRSKYDLFADSVVATSSYWEKMTTPLQMFQRNLHDAMETYHLEKTLLCDTIMTPLTQELTCLCLQNAIYSRLVQYMADSETLLNQQKHNLLQESQQQLSLHLTHRSEMYKAWKKRTIPQAGEPPKRPKHSHSQPADHSDPPPDSLLLTGQTDSEVWVSDSVWLCGDGHWN
jgi:hypothetical protein